MLNFGRLMMWEGFIDYGRLDWKHIFQSVSKRFEEHKILKAFDRVNVPIKLFMHMMVEKLNGIIICPLIVISFGRVFFHGVGYLPSFLFYAWIYFCNGFFPFVSQKKVKRGN
jgi:hypothetical protein